MAYFDGKYWHLPASHKIAMEEIRRQNADLEAKGHLMTADGVRIDSNNYVVISDTDVDKIARALRDLERGA